MELKVVNQNHENSRFHDLRFPISDLRFPKNRIPRIHEKNSNSRFRFPNTGLKPKVSGFLLPQAKASGY